MEDTAKGIIENFISLVHRYGYVPNGNRIYYLLRSQPPLLILMAKTYYTYTEDLNFIKENIKVNCIYFVYSTHTRIMLNTFFDCTLYFL